LPIMAQNVPAEYVLDPKDPRAPTLEQWEAMSPAERERVVNALPTSLPVETHPPEGDLHRKAKQGALGTLEEFFRRAGRRVYLSSELAVYYPGEPSFVPDVLAVLDVESHDRMRWVVAKEGRGLDFVLEVLVAGDPKKDLEANVVRYARLGIAECFVFDRARSRLYGHRIAPTGGGTYQRIVAQGGRYASKVLGLDLLVDGEKLQFFAGNAALEDSDQMIARLRTMMDNVLARAEQEAARAEQEAARADAAEQRADETKRALDAALAELERLKPS
jgi:Uma2 family endonuclease